MGFCLPGGRWARGIAVAAWLAVAPLASGCWDRHEIETLGVATAVAFDVSRSGRGIRLTAQFAIPSRMAGAAGAGGAGGGMGGAGSGPLVPFARTAAGPMGPTAWVVGVEGETVGEAQERMAHVSHRLPFWAHVRLVIIGEELARSGLAGVLDALVRDREFRITPWVVVARGVPGHRLLELPDPLHSVPANGIIRLLQSQSFATAFVRPQRLRDVVIDLVEPGVEPVAPGLTFELPVPPDRTLIPSQEPRPPALAVTKGTAVFRGDRLVGWLTPQQTRALNLLRGDSHPFTLVAPCPSGTGEASVRFIRSTVRRSMRAPAGRPGAGGSPGAAGLQAPEAALPEISVEVLSDGNLADESCQPPLGSTQRRRLERQLGRRLEQELRATVRHLHRELGADAAGFGQMIARGDPKLWNHLAARWHERIADLPVRVTVQARLRRTGLLNGRLDS